MPGYCLWCQSWVDTRRDYSIALLMVLIALAVISAILLCFVGPLVLIIYIIYVLAKTPTRCASCGNPVMPGPPVMPAPPYPYYSQAPPYPPPQYPYYYPPPQNSYYMHPGTYPPYYRPPY
jgi:hypothetical protein